MTFIRNNYVVRKRLGAQSGHRTDEKIISNWWLVKHHGDRNSGHVQLGNINIPSEYVGKKVRFKIEIMEDKL